MNKTATTATRGDPDGVAADINDTLDELRGMSEMSDAATSEDPNG